MRGFSLFIVMVMFTSCRPAVRINGRTLADTLEIIKKKADFRPLDSAEAYEFINKYYLPRLDTMPIKRKILLYSLRGVNFNEYFKLDKGRIEAEYAGNKNTWVPPTNLSPPSFLNKRFRWDSKKLSNTNVISDSLLLMNSSKVPLSPENWHKKYGNGYMCISYPQYNANTKLLVLREWTENHDECGTGRDHEFHYKKIHGGWEAY